METTLTWLDVLKLSILLIAGLLVLKTLQIWLPQFFKRKSVFNKISNYLNSTIELYKLIAILVLLIALVGINYKIHGVVLLLGLIITFSYIKSYLHGVIFKLNPLVKKGSKITVGDCEGQLYSFLAFGVILNQRDGNRFMNYSFIEKNGFTITQTDQDAGSHSVYVHDLENPSRLLDVLFDNPMVDFNIKPSITKVIDQTNRHVLRVTLEKGAGMEALRDYLQQHNITISLTK